MGTRELGIGIVFGSFAFGAFALRTPPDSPESHPLPSATAEYSKHASKPRYLPWFSSSRANPEVEEESFDKTQWVSTVVRVVDLDRRPVANAEVEVRLDARGHALANASVEEYDDLVAAEEAGAIRFADQPMIVVDRGRTNADGLYVTKLEPHITASVIVRDGDREGVSGSLAAVPGSELLQEVQVEVAPIATLAGRIENGDGDPVADAVISLVMRGSQSLSSDLFALPPRGLRTASDGSFRVTVRGGGAVDVYIAADGFQPLSLMAVQVLPGSVTTRDITLASAARIAGRVLDANGQGISARIEMHALDSVGGHVTFRQVMTEIDGSFVASDLAPARYRLVAHADGLVPSLIEPVDAGGAPIEIRLDAGGVVRGEVLIPPQLISRLAPGSEPQAMWATVFVLPSDPRVGSPIVLPSSSVTIDENGRGSFEMVAVPAGRWTLRTQVMNVATLDRQIDVARSSDTSHTIFFEDGMAASVSGRVLSARGSIDAGSIYLSPENGGLAVSATIRAGGEYEMPWVAPGKYTVSVSAYLGGSYESYYAPVEIHGRTVRLDVETVAPPAVAESEWVPENYESSDYQPEVDIEWTTDGAIVSGTLDVNGVRVWAGDRVTSIDGETVGADGAAMARLRGTEGSICRLRLERPATGETYSLEVPRTRVERRYGCGLSRSRDW